MALSWYVLLLALLLIQTGQVVCLASEEITNNEGDKQITQQLIEWLRANGAYINPKVEVRYIDETGVRGVFATDTLEDGELVSRIPHELILQPEPQETRDSNCGTVYEAVKAMKDKSNAYGQYLLAQPRDYLPAFWSESGAKLLEELLGDHLPPHDIEDILTLWDTECKGRVDLNDPLQKHAAMIVTARADYKFLVPFYDMMNHRNGKWYNVRHNREYNDQAHVDFEVVTAKQINAGEELYNSYNQCNICHYYYNDWLGTAEMLNRYGFVESMPQRWFFDDARIKFDLDYKNDESNTDELEVTFKVPPSEGGISFLRKELKRLQEFGGKHKGGSNKNDTIPQSEWDTLWQFHSALVVAITHALDSISNHNVKLTNDVWKMGKYWYVEEGHKIPEYEEEVAVRYGHEVEEVQDIDGDEL